MVPSLVNEVWFVVAWGMNSDMRAIATSNDAGKTRKFVHCSFTCCSTSLVVGKVINASCFAASARNTLLTILEIVHPKASLITWRKTSGGKKTESNQDLLLCGNVMISFCYGFTSSSISAAINWIESLPNR